MTSNDYDTEKSCVYSIEQATRHENGTYFTWLIMHTSEEYHSHDYWEIAYLLEGNATHRLNGETFSLTKGDAFILRPQDKHCLCRETKASEKYLHRDLYVPTDVMKEICNAISPSEPLYEHLLTAKTPPQFHISHSKRQTIEQTATLLQKSQFTHQDMFFRSLIVELLAYYFSLETINDYPAWIINLINNVKRDTSNNKNLDSFIRSTGYSHAHVCREFKKYTGERLNEFVTKTRLEYSTALLLSTQNSVADIAYQLGFSSESNYISCFKKYYGVTPHRWRRQKP